MGNVSVKEHTHRNGEITCTRKHPHRAVKSKRRHTFKGTRRHGRKNHSRRKAYNGGQEHSVGPMAVPVLQK